MHKFLASKAGVLIVCVAFLLFTAFLFFDISDITKYFGEKKPIHNQTATYADGRVVEMYEEYPYRRLNDLNTHYRTMQGTELEIEKVVDLPSGKIYIIVINHSTGGVGITEWISPSTHTTDTEEVTKEETVSVSNE